MKVLLTDGQQRKTLAMARSLGSRGVEVLAAEETRWAPTLFSRYCRQALLSPSAAKAPDRYFQWLLDSWQEHHYDLLIPMDDHSLGVVMEHQAELSSYCHLLLPPMPAYLTAADKALTVQAAEELGIDCPRTRIPEGLDQVEMLAQELLYPLIIKPRKSSGSRGITLVQRPQDLLPAYRSVHAEYGWPMLQECIPEGDKYDVCLLYDRSGRRQASFVQKELRFFPLARGPSTLQESWHYPELAATADQLLRSLHWQGIAEVEFMIDPRDGRPKLMEVNPRFWGSLACAIFAGMDFPWLLYQLAMHDKCEVPTGYLAGQRCRWLLPGDLLHFATNPRRWQMDPPLIAGKHAHLHDDILSWQDPLPTIGFFSACLHYLTDREMWKTMFQR